MSNVCLLFILLTQSTQVLEMHAFDIKATVLQRNKVEFSNPLLERREVYCTWA